MIKARPTKYRGIQFRSRLEATWAAFFDNLGWDWEYDPFELDGYLPDFVLRFPRPVIVEVKPANSLAEMDQYRAKIESSGWTHDYLIVGTGLFRHGYLHDLLALGLLGQSGVCDDDGNDTWSMDEACFGACDECGRPTFVHVAGTWGSYACNHFFKGQPTPRDYSGMWARAKNMTQWKPPARRPAKLPRGFGA